MPTRISQVSGLSEINKVLTDLPPRLQTNVLQRSVAAGARVILNAAKAAAPSGWAGDSLKRQSPASQKYGTLKSNLSVRNIRLSRKSARGIMVWTKNAFWSVFQEFGTTHQPARPWLRPAFDASQDEAVTAIQDKLLEGVETEAAKLAGPYANAKKSLGVR